MLIEHHDLHHEFPALSDQIHKLKLSDKHFEKLFNEYDRLDHEIRNLEQNGSLISDLEMESLKLNRVRLKDTLYKALIKSV